MDISLLERLIKENHSPKNIKVSVVGAGFAGLFCGWLLNHLGFNVKVYEASDRIGGRVHSINRKGELIEAGGEFIGSNHPIWLLLAKHFGLELEPLVDNDESIFIDDRKLDETIKEQAEEVFAKFSKDAEKISFSDEPWKESEEIQQLDYISVKDKLDEWNVQGDVRKVVEFYIGNDNVCEVDKHSYLGLLCQIKAGSNNGKNFWEDTESFRCSSGNQSLAEALAKDLDVEKNTPITKIKYENDHIICNGNQTDFVVVAVAPSVWKYIDFVNISDMSKYTPDMGQAIKIINYESYPNAIHTNMGQIWNQNDNVCALFAGGSRVNNKNQALDMFNKGLIYNWPKKIFIETGYSYTGVGKVTTVNKLLYEPVSDYGNRLIFAGEHTSPSFCGFMEGALQSGFRAALRI
jgi:monoamine oxidase